MTGKLALGLGGGLLVLLLFVVAFRKSIAGWYFFPRMEFADSVVPPEPDYSKESNWAALPDRKDLADVVPPHSGAADGQADAKVDVFFLHPTTYFSGASWNADTTNALANFVTDHGILTQQASAFNGVAKVYAPRYRQITLGAYQIDKPEQVDQALAVAYSDVYRAFEYYLEHFNHGRPFLIASHSQGTTHGTRLLGDLFAKHPDAAKRLVAAYLIGNEVLAEDLTPFLPVCSTPDQTGCFLSWNSVLRGGDGSHWKREGEPVCVNPLTWTHDEEAGSAELNLGAIPLAGLRGLDTPDTALTGAQCQDGILWIDKPQEPGYTFAVFPGGVYHTYDYNFFYMNIRENAGARVARYLAEHPGSTEDMQ